MTTFNAMLARLVKLSETNPTEAVEALYEALKQAADWREIQQVKLALRHATRNA